jgi:hypothetical protein
MVNEHRDQQRLTLDRPATYEITVPGHLNQAWTEGDVGMTVAIDFGSDGQPITVLTVALDQAALHGLLRRLYGLGLPLMSVICIPCGMGGDDG